ncbi:uncharacterized protein LOC120128634 [Hibiscus syriacus]|uniref:uncharacterized protein LOC120128634 n=1 Tax=Hibiscus syriacus TaxID=106335 RepID=UPI001924898A|nr:uncharacterized protein LOC120128634 [Hibiscus syriacus]
MDGRVAGKRAKLEFIQIYNLAHVDQRRLDKEKKIQAELVTLETAESEFYRQKAKNLIGTTDPMVKGCSVEWLKPFLSYSLPAGAGDFLASPGPDGYTSWFFKAAWEIVSKDFLDAIRYFFQISSLLPAFNATTIVLVPKSLNASFVKGINIADNTLLAQEIVRGYSRKNFSPRCTITIDLQKAFNSICWDFLLTVLEALRLLGVFCGWIRACVITPRYSISLKGRLVGYFKGARGVRQGGSLSPYLFVIVMNVLPSLMDVVAKNGVFRFHPKCKRITLTHLCFADDLLMFCHGSLDAMMGVVSTLDKFYELSGLRLNCMKTELFACVVPADKLEQILRAIGFRVGHLPVRNLGVPLVTRKLTSKDCSALLVKIKDMIDKWSSRKLIFGGRLQLVKSVLFSIFGYWSRQLILPKGVIRDIEKLSDWSKDCCLMLVKNILVGDGSLWIAWIKDYCFKFVDYWNVDIAWMVILDRLPTKDRLTCFGIVTDNVCGLCGDRQESRNHLFLEYSYMREIWCTVMHACGVQQQELNCWDDALCWMISNLKGFFHWFYSWSMVLRDFMVGCFFDA